MKWNDQHIIESIREGKEEGLVYLYQHHKPAFIAWAVPTFQIDDARASDAFQDAVIALRANILEGKYKVGGSSLKTYLFAIAKNKLLYRFKRERKEMNFEDLSESEYLESPAWESLNRSPRAQAVSKAMVMLGEPCLSILKMFYYQTFSMEVIATRLNYKNEQVVKSQKVRCMQHLRKMTIDHRKRD